MAMYKVAGNLDVHVRNMVQTWDQWVEGDRDVFFISSDGTRVPCSRNVIAFYSKMLANILAEASVGIDIGISLPVPCRLINYLIEILTKGEAAVANKRDFSQVKAAAKLIGISLDDLNIGVNKDATNDASAAPVNIKKEIIDDEMFPAFSEAITSQPNVKKRTSVGRPKKILAPQTPQSSVKKNRRTSTSKSAKNVPAEMLLAENSCLDKASINVKKEPRVEPPMVALSEEFETFMKKPELKETTKKSGRGKSAEITGSRKKTPDQSQSAKTVSINLNPKENVASTVTKEQKPTKKNLKHKTLKEIKNDMEETYKPVNITDNSGNLVSSAKKPSASKKVKFAQSKEDLSKAKLVEKKANSTKAPVKNSLMRKFMQRKPIKQESNTFKKAEKKQKLVQGKSSVAAGVGLRKDRFLHMKKYKCDHCDLKFVGNASLEKHIQVKHTVIKKEKLEHNVTTEYEETEDVAIEYEETEETQCPYCFKQFTEFKRLSAHMKIHKDEV